jgi:hypothetical protein
MGNGRKRLPFPIEPVTFDIESVTPKTVFLTKLVAPCKINPSEPSFCDRQRKNKLTLAIPLARSLFPCRTKPWYGS